MIWDDNLSSVITSQAHLEGLFDNVKTVDFHEKNYDQILAVCSREAEKIDLVTPVNAQVRIFRYKQTDRQKKYYDEILAVWSHGAEVE